MRNKVEVVGKNSTHSGNESPDEEPDVEQGKNFDSGESSKEMSYEDNKQYCDSIKIEESRRTRCSENSWKHENKEYPNEETAFVKEGDDENEQGDFSNNEEDSRSEEEEEEKSCNQGNAEYYNEGNQSIYETDDETEQEGDFSDNEEDSKSEEEEEKNSSNQGNAEYCNEGNQSIYETDNEAEQDRGSVEKQGNYSTEDEENVVGEAKRIYVNEEDSQENNNCLQTEVNNRQIPPEQNMHSQSDSSSFSNRNAGFDEFFEQRSQCIGLMAEQTARRESVHDKLEAYLKRKKSNLYSQDKVSIVRRTNNSLPENIFQRGHERHIALLKEILDVSCGLVSVQSGSISENVTFSD
ncbi:hypothetical protein FHG87_003669 [Trinorchestia longiramus]|nr:hypothetical protein FHG87_003669 [Trinorchestia longiramus]